jgi:hypothetical protein
MPASTFATSLDQGDHVGIDGQRSGTRSRLTGGRALSPSRPSAASQHNAMAGIPGKPRCGWRAA